MSVWQWMQNELLGMHWLNEAIGAGLRALGVDTAGRLGGSVQFFLYDTVKITVLLCVLIFGISYIQSLFPAGALQAHPGAVPGGCGPTWLRRFWARSPPSAPALPSLCSWASPGQGCRWV